MNGLPLLTLLTLLPLIGGLVVVGLGAEQKRLARWLSLGFSLGALALALVLVAPVQLRLGRASIPRAALLDSRSWR